MRAFIIRPFGVREGIDFDEVDKFLIAPALKAVKAEGGTTIEILEAGNIRIDMFERLLASDLVVADISTNNPNVFYELGIRHALRGRRTYLIRAKTRSPEALRQGAARKTTGSRKATSKEAEKQKDVPFDIRTDRYLEYDPKAPAKTLDTLIAGLTATVASEDRDSPVFLLLPSLKEQDGSRFIPVPLEFGEEVQRAVASDDAARLTLLGIEAQGFPWESEGLRTVGRALFHKKVYGGAKVAWESMRRVEEYDFEANKMLGNIYQRLGDVAASNQALDRAQRKATEPAQLAEVHGQMGRNKKQMWKDSWSKVVDDGKAEAALRSPLLVEAYEQYLEAFDMDLNAYYPGMNALGLAVVLGELAARMPDGWKERFQDPADAERELKLIGRRREELAATMRLCLEAAQRREKAHPTDDGPWVKVSVADLLLLTLPDAGPAVFQYEKVLADENDFVREAAYGQLEMCRVLGVLTSNVEAALKVVQPSGKKAKPPLDRIIVFAGHRVDDARRTREKGPRFPSKDEEKAREAIRKALQNEKDLAKGPILGVAGGANGGDILFHEECLGLKIPAHLLLALPEDAYIDASVATEDESWVKQFHAIREAQEGVPVLCECEDLPKWLQLRKGYDIWKRNNLWLISYALCQAAKHLTVIVLWDGEGGDGPGGTEDMVKVARDRGARVIHLDTREIFGLGKKRAQL
jgi:tetratricopeptide (TPR) repeat protein